MNQTQQTFQRDLSEKIGFNQILTEEEKMTNTALSAMNGSARSNGKKAKKENNHYPNNPVNHQAMEQAQMKKSSKNHLLHVPPLIEFSITISWAVLVSASVLIGLISYRSGVKGLEFFLRTGSAVFLAGLLLVVFNWIVAQSSYEIHQEKMEKEKRERESEELFNEEIDLDDDIEDNFDELMNGETETDNTPAESKE